MYQDVASATHKTALDCVKAFHQMCLSEDARNKCAFWANGKLMRYKRMPFGGVNAVAVYQRAMDSILTKHTAYSHCYVDDIIVYSSGSPQDHADKVAAVIRSLAEAGLKISPDKSTFAADEVTYLGFRIQRGKLTPEQVIGA